MKDVSKYKEVFLYESKERLETMSKSLLELEKNPGEVELINRIFVEVHTLKSMAASMNYVQSAQLCHALEDVLEAIKKNKVKTQDCIDLLFECIDTLELSLKEISGDKEELNSAALTGKLNTLLSNTSSQPTSERIGSEGSDEVKPLAIEKIKSIEVKVEKLDLLMNLAEELLINKMRMECIKEDLQHPELSAAVDVMGRLITDLQYNVMQSRMVPVGFVFDRFPRMIRDLAKQQGKEVDLHLLGSDIELDRAVIDEIGDSLVHLLRNAVAHGIETPEARRKAGKSALGNITLTAKESKDTAIIEVTDDGAGMDFKDLKETAINRGIISPDATPEEVTNAIFSGVSITSEVTAVSGRGFGLKIAHGRISSLGGSITVKSEKGKGTIFSIGIPLTLAIIKSLFVEVAGKTYAIPIAHVDRLAVVTGEQVKGIMSYEALVIEEEDIPLTRLDALFGLPSTGHENQPVVIIRKDGAKLGLAVDALLGTEEIVKKPLNRLVRENKYFSGCTIAGSGEVVLILDVSNLILSQRKQIALAEKEPAKDFSALALTE
jgi:two-component system, chemotaxis family, sensor kinase CheA